MLVGPLSTSRPRQASSGARGVVAALLAATALASTCGCGSPALQTGPSDSLRAYARAIEDDRVDDAWRLLSAEAKRNLPLDAFRRMVRENPADAKEMARALARPALDPVVTATVTTPKGESLVLVYEGGAFRLDASTLDLYAQGTPRQALESFLRAFEKKRWDVLMRFVPDAHAEGLDAAKLRVAWEETPEERDEMARVTAAIRAAMASASIETTGDRAAMPYGNASTVSFVKEHGSWKIEDFD